MIVVEFLVWLFRAALHHWELTVGLVIASGIGLWGNHISKRTLMATQKPEPSRADKERTRARVGAYPGPLHNFGPNLAPTTMVEFHNSGETPARDLSVEMWSALDRYPLPVGYALEKPPITTTAVRTDLHRGGEPCEATVRWHTPLHAQAVADIIDGTKWRIYDYGTARYTDVFGDRWYVDFCFTRGGPSLAENRSEVCHLHNSSGPDKTPP